MLTYGPLVIKGQISNVISLHGMPDLSSFEYSNWPVRFSLWCLHTCLKYIGLSLKASPYSPQPMCLISVKGTSTTLRPWYGLDLNPRQASSDFPPCISSLSLSSYSILLSEWYFTSRDYSHYALKFEMPPGQNSICDLSRPDHRLFHGGGGDGRGGGNGHHGGSCPFHSHYAVIFWRQGRQSLGHRCPPYGSLLTGASAEALSLPWFSNFPGLACLPFLLSQPPRFVKR